MTCKRAAQRDRRALIKQNLHTRWLRSFKAALRVLDHGVDLLARDARKPLEEVLNGGTALDVLEERLHRYTGTLEKPGAADFPGDTFNRWALTPIKQDDKMV